MANKQDFSQLGYTRLDGVSSIDVMQNLSRKNSLKAAFSEAHGPVHDPHKQLQLTDIMPHTKFTLPNIKAETVLDVSKPVRVEPQGAGIDRDKVNNVADKYLEANQSALKEIETAVKAADPEHGKAVWNAIKPEEPTTGGIAGLALDLETGGAGSVYETINAAYKQANRPDSTKINEVLSKALSSLHEKSKQETMAYASGQRAKPPEFDFRAIRNARQLQDFVERDPMDDKVMQQVADAHEALDLKDRNKKDYDENYTTTGDIPAKIIAAQEQGKTDLVKKLVKDDTAAEAVTAASTQLENSSILQSLKGIIKIKPEAVEKFTEPTQAAKPALGMESDMRNLPQARPASQQLTI